MLAIASFIKLRLQCLTDQIVSTPRYGCFNWRPEEYAYSGLYFRVNIAVGFCRHGKLSLPECIKQSEYLCIFVLDMIDFC